MKDYFALLGVPRRPWLDVARLKDGFAELSARCHPDKFPNASKEEHERISARYAEFNEAFQCLCSTRDRLLHLIELEAGKRPTDVQRIPAGTGELFMEVGQVCSGAEAFLAGRPKTESPILKAKMFVENMEWTDKLTTLLNKVNAMRSGFEQELQKMSTDCDQRVALSLVRLEEIYRSMSYVERWTEQIRERLVQLAV